MSATVTLTTSLQPLCLFPQEQPPATKTSPLGKCVNSPGRSSAANSSPPPRTDDSVEALARQLQTCGPISDDAQIKKHRMRTTNMCTRFGEIQKKSTVSSKLVFDTDALCDDDGAYVHVFVGPRGERKQRMQTTDTTTNRRHDTQLVTSTRSSSSANSMDKSPSSSSCLLLHEQPVSNPFKTLMRASPPPPIPSSAPPIASFPTQTISQACVCVHCKRGNFLEFCFAGDRCACVCHTECPCNPCNDIRRARRSGVSSRGSEKTLVRGFDLDVGRHGTLDVCARPLATAPISRCLEETQ